jgi:hypothetical protein
MKASCPNAKAETIKIIENLELESNLTYRILKNINKTIACKEYKEGDQIDD